MAVPATQQILESQGWHVPNSIMYSYNTHGFRDEDFDDRPCAMALGCSFTQGVGVDGASAWPHRLSAMMDLHVWNLGVGGAALDTIFRIADHYLEVLRPRSVFLLLPSRDRLEYADSDSTFDVLFPNTLQSHAAGDFIKNWFSHEANSKWNQKKNLYAIMHLCDQHRVPLYVLDSQTNGNDCLGRDLLHPGKSYHDIMAKKFFQMIER